MSHLCKGISGSQMENEGTGFLEDEQYAGPYDEYGEPLPLGNEAAQITQEMAHALVDEQLSIWAKVCGLPSKM